MFNYEKFLKDGTINKKQLLLNYYHLINLNENELVVLLIIQDMIDLNILVTSKSISSKMKLSQDRIDKILGKLIEKKYICYDTYSSKNNIDNEQLYQVIIKKIIKEDIEYTKSINKNKFEDIQLSFEEEFNRKLSPLELEKLEQWSNSYKLETIKTALAEAVYNDILNFKQIEKYIKSNK
ncbi:MAG: DnaD domain protein [Bacilli bacterium]|jgi:DnaD/phage-associated family protein|nr:DnaD domain protein [Bacilli bacterium]